MRMDYCTVKWIIFTALTLTVPAILFLVVVVMIMPAVFFFPGIGYSFFKLFKGGSIGETLSFVVIFGGHALVYTALYYALSVVIARLINLIGNNAVRVCTVAVLCLALAAITQFPVYGGGGHGPMRWHNLAALLAEVNKSYGAGSAQLVYGAAVLLVAGFLLRHHFRKKKSLQAGALGAKAGGRSAINRAGGIGPGGPDQT